MSKLLLALFETSGNAVMLKIGTTLKHPVYTKSLPNNKTSYERVIKSNCWDDIVV